MPAAFMTATPGIWQGLCRFSVWGVAIGQNAQTQEGMFGESIGYGTRTGLRGINLGYYTAASGVGRVALGGLGTSALTDGSVALGKASYAGTQAGDVALGSQSQTGCVAPAANASVAALIMPMRARRQAACCRWAASVTSDTCRTSPLVGSMQGPAMPPTAASSMPPRWRSATSPCRRQPISVAVPR